MTEQEIERLFQLGIKYDRAGNFDESIKIHKELADNAHVESIFNYAWALHEGFGINKNLKTSFEWMKKAADLGHSKAQYNTGVFYDTGIGGTQDYEKALQYFLLAAEQGIDDAQRNAALMLLKGIGGKKDELKAEELLLSAAEQNLTSSYYNLGEFYYERYKKEISDFTKRINLNTARNWFCKSFENGDKSAEKMIQKIDNEISRLN